VVDVQSAPRGGDTEGEAAESEKEDAKLNLILKYSDETFATCV
jgi:hypothetical protein